MRQDPNVVNVVRHDYKERVIHFKNGREQVIPEFHECMYTYKGREIAMYNSKDDVLYLNSRCLNAGKSFTSFEAAKEEWKKPVYERALKSEYKEAFGYLFHMLNADKTTRMSEYSSM